MLLLIRRKKSQVYQKYSNKYSGRQYPKYNKYQSKNKHFETNKFYQKPKSNKWKRKPFGKIHSKNPEQKGNFYKYGNYGHYANKCHVKKTINQLKISEEEKLQLIQVLELRDTDHSQSEDDLELSSSDNNFSSGLSSPDIKLGCTDACCKKISVLNKQEEQEVLLIELISKVDDPELKSFYLKKTKEVS